MLTRLLNVRVVVVGLVVLGATAGVLLVRTPGGG